MKPLAKKHITFGEEIEVKKLYPFKDYPVACLILNEREEKLCSSLKIETLGNLAETQVQMALTIRNLWYRSVQSLITKLAQFVVSWNEIERDFLNTAFTEILQRLARQVPEKERFFFIRRHFYGETLNEIGKNYGLTREGVRQKLLKAQRSLQTPNWERLVEQYLEKYIVPWFKDKSGKLLPTKEIKKELEAKFRGNLASATATFVLLEQLYFAGKHSECAKVVRISRKLLEKMSKHTFDAYYRRACRQGHIGQKIKMLRNLNDWTQDYLAKQIGCTRITVNMWEQGKSIPGGRNLEKIAQVFGLSKEALLMIG